jgi:SH3-like domain-containing protein
MHEGADDRSPIIKDIEVGTKVEIVDQIDEWIKVVTVDTESGWIKESEIVRI